MSWHLRSAPQGKCRYLAETGRGSGWRSSASGGAARRGPARIDGAAFGVATLPAVDPSARPARPTTGRRFHGLGTDMCWRPDLETGAIVAAALRGLARDGGGGGAAARSALRGLGETVVLGGAAAPRRVV